MFSGRMPQGSLNSSSFSGKTLLQYGVGIRRKCSTKWIKRFSVQLFWTSFIKKHKSQHASGQSSTVPSQRFSSGQRVSYVLCGMYRRRQRWSDDEHVKWIAFFFFSIHFKSKASGLLASLSAGLPHTNKSLCYWTSWGSVKLTLHLKPEDRAWVLNVPWCWHRPLSCLFGRRSTASRIRWKINMFTYHQSTFHIQYTFSFY